MAIVYYQMFRRKPDMEPAAFNRAFAAYARRLRELTAGLGAVELEFDREWGQRVNDTIALTRGARRPFDGVVRIAIADPADFMRRIGAIDPGRLDAELAAAQAEFADLHESVYGFSERFDPDVGAP